MIVQKLSVLNKLIFLGIILFIFVSCDMNPVKELSREQNANSEHIRQDWQMDSILQRIEIQRASPIEELKLLSFSKPWKTLICPQDYSAYAGHIYTESLRNLKAKTVIVFGAQNNPVNPELKDKLIFGSFTNWKLPKGKLQISELQNDLMEKLNPSYYTINNELHEKAHFLEPILSHLQAQNPEIQVIPILIPAFTKDALIHSASSLSDAIKKILREQNLNWGLDFAMLVSADAVHYGTKGWKNKNQAPYGTDYMGTAKAGDHDMNIIESCLLKKLSHPKIIQLMNETISESKDKEYVWPWNGRYAIPLGLMTTYYLNGQLHKGDFLYGKFITYATSNEFSPIQHEDLGLHISEPANHEHWVGYAAVGYY